MTRLDPKALLAIGLVLMIIGWILPFLMMLDVIPSSFFLNFFSFAASTLGLFLGIIGIAILGPFRGK